MTIEQELRYQRRKHRANAPEATWNRDFSRPRYNQHEALNESWWYDEK